MNNQTPIGNLVPPHNAEAERAVLSAIMFDRNAIHKAVEWVEPDSFYVAANRIIYEAMLALFGNSTEIDIITLSEELRLMGKLEETGGMAYLADLSMEIPTAANIELHCRILREKQYKRLMITAGGQMITASYDDTTDALETLDRASTTIFAIAEKRFKRACQTFMNLATNTSKLIHDIASKKQLPGLPTGIITFDRMTGGLHGSDLIILAARPGMGKTAIALNIASHVAIHLHRPVAFFSLEMEAKQLMMRLLSNEAGVDSMAFRTGRITDVDLHNIDTRIAELSKTQLFIDDTANLDLLELRAKCKRLKAENRIELIIIDYLQFMQPPKAESREREISLISRTLKQIAKELDIPVLALAQLNRMIESRADKRPQLSDLRESGSLEQDADVVLFLNRPELFGLNTFPDGTATAGKAELIISKQRNGMTGTVRMSFAAKYTRFTDNENQLTDEDFQQFKHFQETEKEEAPF